MYRFKNGFVVNYCFKNFSYDGIEKIKKIDPEIKTNLVLPENIKETLKELKKEYYKRYKLNLNNSDIIFLVAKYFNSI